MMIKEDGPVPPDAMSAVVGHLTERLAASELREREMLSLLEWVLDACADGRQWADVAAAATAIRLFLARAALAPEEPSE